MSGNTFFNLYRSPEFHLTEMNYCKGNLLKSVTALLLLLCCLISGAQNQPGKPVFRFRHLNVDINSNRIESIIQDRHGFIWIGTLGGLHRYDGLGITTFFTSDDTTSVSGNRSGCLFEDSHGRLWIGTENGICYYNREKDWFERYQVLERTNKSTSVRSNKISSITEDDHGLIWIASEKGGLLYLDEHSRKFIPSQKVVSAELNHAQVITVYYKDKTLWIGTADNGLFRMDMTTSAITHFSHDPLNENSIGGNYIEDLVVDRNNYLWIATHESGLDKLNLNANDNRFIHYKHKLDDPTSLANDDVTTVYEDASGRIWVCNENGGLHLYNPHNNNFFRYEPDPSDPFSISNISVKAFYQDRQGRFWAGSNLEGIDIADKYIFRFNHYYQSDNFQSINNNIVRNFLEDDSGALWIATDGGGLNYFDREKNEFKFFRHDPHDARTISSNAVLSLCKDNEGNIWIGTWRGGINILNPKTGVFKRIEPDNHSISKVFNIMRDSQENMWVTTQSGGISVYDAKTKRFTSYMHDPQDSASLGGNDVAVILEDSDGKIWVGTEFNGINLMITSPNGDVKFKRFIHRSGDPFSLASDGINHLFEDSKRNLWIASEGGLSRFIKEDSTFRNYSVKHGLESNHIKSVIEDDRGFLWLGTAKGISRFDPVHEVFRNYTHNDGLQRGEFSRYSVCKTKHGEIVFGGTNGFNIFHPDSIADNPFYPGVFITGLKIFNIPVKIGEEGSPLSKHITETESITLSYKQSVFSFDFVALNYTHPSMNQYAFKMEGFENDWNYVGSQRTATYTSLDAGEYVFRVKASNNDGLWNEEGRSIRIIIRPPVWKTTWFKIIVALLLVAVIYLVMQYRVRHLNKTNLELEEKVNQRTYQLKQLVDDLRQKQMEVESANRELTKAHNELESVNSQLDKRVQERTLKLVKANQQLDSFVYSASHDLSAPLKSILGLINILRLDEYNTGIMQHLDHMQKSVVKLETVIYHLTQFSRNMGGPVTIVTFAFGDVLEEVLEDLKYFSNAHNIHIIKEYCDEDMLTSDFMRMKIILTNLISNAIKYYDKNKADNYIRIKFGKGTAYNTVSIEDNGIGIDAEHQQKIFNMFFRATAKSEGSGLGLYIVKDVVEKLEGTIDVRCQNGVTRFTLTLPVKQMVIE